MKKMAARCKEKLALLYFVMAAQASYICFSFYNALDIKKKYVTVPKKMDLVMQKKKKRFEIYAL